MALLGSAALAMWWDMAAALRPEFEHWHTHEHFPERLGIPGFRRASRWWSDGDGVFVMYELSDYEVLTSAAYLERLNAPTPWSTKMMPHHRNMVRCQCRVLESRGGVASRHALTVRLAPAPGRADALRDALRSLVERLVIRPGLTGAHLLCHERPSIATTAEQKLRGGDLEADWIIVVGGYDAAALKAVADTDADPASLEEAGAAPGAVCGLYALSYSATPTDMA